MDFKRLRALRASSDVIDPSNSIRFTAFPNQSTQFLKDMLYQKLECTRGSSQDVHLMYQGNEIPPNRLLADLGLAGTSLLEPAVCI